MKLGWRVAWIITKKWRKVPKIQNTKYGMHWISCSSLHNNSMQGILHRNSPLCCHLNYLKMEFPISTFLFYFPTLNDYLALHPPFFVICLSTDKWYDDWLLQYPPIYCRRPVLRENLPLVNFFPHSVLTGWWSAVAEVILWLHINLQQHPTLDMNSKPFFFFTPQQKRRTILEISEFLA